MDAYPCCRYVCLESFDLYLYIHHSFVGMVPAPLSFTLNSYKYSSRFNPLAWHSKSNNSVMYEHGIPSFGSNNFEQDSLA